MIYSLSIFSHINIEDQSLWLEELSRVTKPGGYVFLSIEGFKSLKYWLHIELGLDLKDASEKLNKNGYIFSAYKNWESISKQNKNFRNASQLVGVKSPYGIMVMNESFIYKNWNRHNFEVLDVIKGIITTRQDLVILRKKM
jgi:ubiquinone/menaquinone biosynthesis C-methylase UbiE